MQKIDANIVLRYILNDQEVILQALEYFGKNTLDFVDCVLAGYAEVEKDKIYTFDEKLQKLIDKIK